MANLGIDTNTDVRPYLASLTSGAGLPQSVSYVGRYLNRMNADEAHAISDAGLHLFSIFEIGNAVDYFTAARGDSDAQAAWLIARGLGQPSGRPIYVAIDQDMMGADLTRVADYMTAVNAAFRALAGSDPDGLSYAVGVYGPWDVLELCASRGLATFLWQCCSTSYSAGRTAKAFPGVSMRQVFHPKPLPSGLGVDLNFSDDGVDEGSWSFAPPTGAP